MIRQKLREQLSGQSGCLVVFLKSVVFVIALQLLVGLTPLLAQDTTSGPNPVPSLDIYGFAMMDTGYEFKQADPDWFDVVRPTKLPSFTDEFGKDGHWFAGVRQSRLGFTAYIPTAEGRLKTIFEFELFGTGVDSGQTTFRLRHAWGELGQFGAGQTWSVFMDPDVFPNSIEYWGPNAMVFFRNVQVRYTPWTKGNSNFMVALERPGASGDQGNYADRIELSGVTGRFPAPDVSTHLKLAGDKGHIQIAGIYRRITWDDLNATPARDFSGSANGWGINVSSNVKFSKSVLRLQYVYGEGIQNYMNDAPADIGVENNFRDARRPLLGKALPLSGVVAFYDINWNEEFSTSVGYSRLDIDNSNGQAATAFKSGQYALANILYYPVTGVMLGPEIQWGYRDNKTGFHSSDYKIQFSAKYNFSFKLGG